MADQQAVPSYVTCFGEPKAKGRLAKSGNDQRCLSISRHSMTSCHQHGCNRVQYHHCAQDCACTLSICQPTPCYDDAIQPEPMLHHQTLSFDSHMPAIPVCSGKKKEEILTSRRSFRLCQTQCLIRRSITFLMPDCIECRRGFGITHFKLASRARYTNLRVSLSTSSLLKFRLGRYVASFYLALALCRFLSFSLTRRPTHRWRLKVL